MSLRDIIIQFQDKIKNMRQYNDSKEPIVVSIMAILNRILLSSTNKYYNTPQDKIIEQALHDIKQEFIKLHGYKYKYEDILNYRYIDIHEHLADYYEIQDDRITKKVKELEAKIRDTRTKLRNISYIQPQKKQINISFMFI